MKKRILVGITTLVLGIAAPVFGDQPDELTSLFTIYGQHYTKVEVLKADPDGLLFRHAKGIAKIPFANLSEDVQKRFNYKPEAAEAFVKEHFEAEKAAREKAAAERAERRKQELEAKAYADHLRQLRQQAATQNTAGAPAYGWDYGAPIWGYGYGYDGFYGNNHRPGHGGHHGARGPRGVENSGQYISHYRPGSNPNVASFLTFGGYRFPVDASRAPRQGWHGPQFGPYRPQGGAPAYRGNSGGARIGGTGTLMQVPSSRISHH